MERIAVESSNILSIGYDPTNAVLEVEFKKSGIYQYFGVPESVYNDLMSASSKGSYLNDHVKKAGYSSQKVG